MRTQIHPKSFRPEWSFVKSVPGLLRDVEPPDEGPHGLAPLADFDEHVAVHLRQGVPGVNVIIL
jgi:hypothetical protein